MSPSVCPAMSPSVCPPRPDPAALGILFPHGDAGDASSDDGDSLQTPLTQHAAGELFDEYQQGGDPRRLEGELFSFVAKQQQPDAALSPLSPFASLLEGPHAPAQHEHFYPAASSPPHALDLANASLELSFAPGPYALNPAASPFAPAKDAFDAFSSSAAAPSTPGCLSPLASLPVDGLQVPAGDSSLLLSAPELENALALLGRMYSPRFPAAHALNPFFVRAYHLGDELGAGGYGFVMTARHRTEGHEVAVKFIVKEKVPEHAWWEDEAFGRVPTEVMLLSLVDHPNIVKCLDLYEDERYFYMVQELHGSPWVSKKKSKSSKQVTAPGKLVVPSPSATPSLTPSHSFESTPDVAPHTPPSISVEDVDPQPHKDGEEGPGDTSPHHSPLAPHADKARALPVRPNFSRRPSHDLFECIEQSKHKRLSESQARFVFAQVVEAVHYLARQGITHCDIKDENLLVDSELRVKLIDFGSAVVADPRAPHAQYYTLFFGTTAYAASEILRKQPYRAPPAEVWTLGVLLSYLLTGHSPFATEQDAIDGRVALREPAAGRLSRAAVALVKRCLERDPERRADIEEVRNHRWLAAALERGAAE